MGAVADALSNAAGTVNKGVNSATNAAGLTSNNSSYSLPQMDTTQQIMSAGGMDPSQVALGGGGIPQGALTAANPNAPQSTVPGLNLNDLLGGSNPQATQQLAMDTNPGVNNPYAPVYMQSTPQAAAASIGAPQNFTPMHKEGTLAKIGDFFFHNMFRDRTVAANERDALEASMGPDGKIDPQAAAKALYSIPGANPMHVAQLLQSEGQTQFYNDYGQMRSDEAQKYSIGTVSAGFGPQSPIGQAMAAGQDPSPIYDKMRPIYDTYLEKAGVPEDIRNQMLPEKFDPDVAQSVASMGTSTADQARINLEAQRTANQQNYQQQELKLRGEDLDLNKVGKELQAQELGVRRAEALSTIQKNNTDYLTNKQTMITKSLGPQTVKMLPWLFNGFMTNRWAPQVQTGKLYWAPDKAMVARPMGDGTTKLYVPDGKGKLIYKGLIGSSATAQTNTNGDFDAQ